MTPQQQAARSVKIPPLDHHQSCTTAQWLSLLTTILLASSSNKETQQESLFLTSTFQISQLELNTTWRNIGIIVFGLETFPNLRKVKWGPSQSFYCAHQLEAQQPSNIAISKYNVWWGFSVFCTFASFCLLNEHIMACDLNIQNAYHSIKGCV